MENPHTVAAFEYRNQIIRSAIHSIKYKHRSRVAKVLAERSEEIIMDFLSENMLVEEDTKILLVPIPLSLSHKYKRGFNQATFIARVLSKYLKNSIVLPKALKRTRNTKPQTAIRKRDARIKNIRGVFRSTIEPTLDEIVIVVDDVSTTGATLAAALAAFKERGWERVYGFALAHGSLN